MRQIGSIEDREQAARFGAYLTTQGISCSVDIVNSKSVIWIHEEDQVATAKEELQRFLAEPDDERYRNAERVAKTVNQQKTRRSAAVRGRTIDLRDRWSQPAADQTPVTIGLIALMVVVAFVTRLEPKEHLDVSLKLYFSIDGTLGRIWAGEVWRLVTPIFLHTGFLHCFFNLMCLLDFGMAIEYRMGTPKYFGMVLMIAILSNYAQFSLGSTFFGGMSGVNYGLFGYALVRSRLDPQSGHWVSRQTVILLLGWYVFCLIGVIPNIANWAHTGGLVAGAAAGASGPIWRSLTGRR